MRRSIILYGLALAALLILLKWLEWRFVIYDHAIELYSGALALVFTGLGIWLALKLARPKVRTEIITQQAAAAPTAAAAAQAVAAAAPEAAAAAAPPETAKTPASPEAQAPSPAEPSQQDIDTRELARLGLSAREQEVLQLMAEGHSNQEIADRLFVSLNTVKTHCSRIFEKLDVKRRTQAIEKSRRLRLIRQ